jgi:hypothetical protein
LTDVALGLATLQSCNSDNSVIRRQGQRQGGREGRGSDARSLAESGTAAAAALWWMKTTMAQCMSVLG